METFTPVSSVLGGALIGLAAVFLMALNGRIAGVSGISAGLLSWSKLGPDTGWRLAFVAGLIAAPPMLGMVGVEGPPVTMVTSTGPMAIGGALVGFGTVLGNGCTSGHGVCGIARLSLRSLIATAVFIVAGATTVFLIRHSMGG